MLAILRDEERIMLAPNSAQIPPLVRFDAQAPCALRLYDSKEGRILCWLTVVVDVAVDGGVHLLLTGVGHLPERVQPAGPLPLDHCKQRGQGRAVRCQGKEEEGVELS